MFAFETIANLLAVAGAARMFQYMVEIQQSCDCDNCHRATMQSLIYTLDMELQYRTRLGQPFSEAWPIMQKRLSDSGLGDLVQAIEFKNEEEANATMASLALADRPSKTERMSN